MSFFVEAIFQDVLSKSEHPSWVDLIGSYTVSIPGFCLRSVLVAYEYTRKVELLLHSIKYSWERERISEFWPWFDWLSWRLVSFDHDATVIVPIPSHFLRILLRWPDMVHEYARRVAPAPFRIDPLLYRTRFSKPQSGLARSGRLVNVKNTFSVRPNRISTIEGKDIVLIDDIITSGATVHEAWMVLLACWARSVHGMFLASPISDKNL